MKPGDFTVSPWTLVQTMPYLAYLALARTGQDTQMAGWTGCALAVAVILGFAVLRRPAHPLLLGTNIHMSLAAPLITGTYEAGFPEAGGFMIAYAETGVLVVVFLTGVAMTFLSQGGFLGEPAVEWNIRWRFSLLMLILAGGMIPFSIANHEQPLLAIAAPMIVLFLLRNYLAGLATRPRNPS